MFGMNSFTPVAPKPAALPSDNIFVGGIPFDWTQNELNTFFSAYGTIVSSIVLKDKVTGQSKGAGMVRYADVNAAATAVQTVNGHVMEGTAKALEVRFADAGSKQSNPLAANRFQPYPPAPGIKSFPSQMAPQFSGMMAQQQAMAPQNQFMQMQNGGIGGANLVIPKPAFASEEGYNLHVFGLDTQVNDLHLYQAFAPYGAISSVRVATLPGNAGSKGYGFVRFVRQSDAHAAMEALNGQVVGRRTWSITPHQKKTL